MEGFANAPIPDDIFQDLMHTPSSLNDVFFDRIGPENRRCSWQSRPYPRCDSGMTLPTQHGDIAQGGHNLEDATMAQRGAGFGMAPPTPGDVSYSASGREFASGNGGHSDTISRTVTPSPDTSQKFSGLASQSDSDFDGQPGSSETSSQGD